VCAPVRATIRKNTEGEGYSISTSYDDIIWEVPEEHRTFYTYLVKYRYHRNVVF